MWLRTFVLMLLLLGCGSVRAQNNPETTSQDVTYCQLVKNPSAFAGKRIRVRAIFRYFTEIQRLESPMCCPEPGPKISVEFEISLEGHSLKLFRRFPEGGGLVLATFVGTFKGGGTYGYFSDRYELAVDQIEKLERKARPHRKQDEPAWVPKNCNPSGAALPQQNPSTALHEAQLTRAG